MPFMKKFLSVLLIILSPLSLLAGLITTVMVSGRFPVSSTIEAMYHTARFAWIFFVFMLIPLGCLVFGIGLKIKKNLIIGIVFSALILLYGGLLSVSLTRFSTDTTYLDKLETEVGINLPDGITVVTEHWTVGNQTSKDDYLLCYDSVARFPSTVETTAFVQEMDTDKWMNDKESIAKSIPTVTNIRTNGCEYFLLYCYDTATFNVAVSEAQYTYVYIAVDTEENVLYITEFLQN